MKNTNGMSIEDAEVAAEMRDEQWIEDELAKSDPKVRNATCCVCKCNWVDVMSGQDTCEDCKP